MDGLSEDLIPLWRKIGRNWVLALVGGIFLAFGTLLVYFDSSEEARKSSSWPSVEGTVVSSEYTRSQSTGGESRGISENADITYSYSVDGKQHHGSKIRFGNAPGGTQAGSEQTAKAAVARYPAGKAVTVYYDHDDPSSTVLEPGDEHLPAFGARSFGTLFVVGSLALLLLVGICRLVMLVSRPQKDGDGEGAE